MKKHLGWLALLATIGTTGAFAEQLAQDEVLRGDTVVGRPRPDYDPAGIRVGGFIFYPDLTLQESYDSNIFATSDSNAKSDLITTMIPTFALKSNWNNHALNFLADSTIVKYANHSTEDFTDYTAAADGRLDIMHDARLFGGGGYRVRHEPRSSPNNLGGKNLTEYQIGSANLAAEKEFNRVSLRLDGNIDRYDYRDQLANNGTLIKETLRNRTEEQIALRTGYELAPLRQVYLLGRYNWRNYDHTFDVSGFNRNSTGYTAAVGANYDLTGVTSIDLFIGYRQQDYSDSRLSSLKGPTGGAKLSWNVTRLTTLTGSLTRDVQETVLGGSSGYFQTIAEVRADHELLRNLLLNASLGYEDDAFQGITRTDDYYLLGAGAKYLINRYFSLSGGYNFRSRSSNAPANGFDEHILFLRVSAHL